MKKFLALFLATTLLLLCFTGCSNRKTYYTDKENFELKLYPNNTDGQVASGVNSIQMIMNTPNVESGSGEIAVFEKDTDKEILRYDIRLDNDSIYFNSSTSPAYSQVIIILPKDKSFEQGKTYYVTVDEKFLYIDDIKGFNGEIKKGDWEFTIADYGIDGNINDIPNVYLVGDKIELPVKVTGKAASAILSYDNVSVLKSDLRELRENGTFCIDTLSAGTSSIEVMFLDEEGKYIETFGFNVTVK